ncbi:hypothetical protein G6F56_004296 [Rhizopus delemar]|nr:hypothetical protein G6F56_004296 [Rhizopus delemar]
MSTSDSSNAARGFYLPREERKFWGIYYLHKHGVNLSGIKGTVELPKSTVHNILRTELIAMDIMISRQTVIACLKSLGFESYFAAHKPRLTEVNIKKSLRWAMEHINWTEDQWKKCCLV